MNYYQCASSVIKLTNSQVINSNGYALDARQNNPDISGSLRCEVNKLNGNVGNCTYGYQVALNDTYNNYCKILDIHLQITHHAIVDGVIRDVDGGSSRPRFANFILKTARAASIVDQTPSIWFYTFNRIEFDPTSLTVGVLPYNGSYHRLSLYIKKQAWSRYVVTPNYYTPGAVIFDTSCTEYDELPTFIVSTPSVDIPS